MDITNRNFFRVLSQGAFGQDEDLEPLSGFKWNKILQIAESQNVITYISKGLMAHRYDEAVRLTDDVWDMVEKAALERQQDVWNTTLSILQQEPQPANFYLKYKYNRILHKDNKSEDSSICTQQLLTIIVNNINQMLTTGIPLRGIVDMGIFLRQRGDRVDFVRLEHWLHQLGFVRMASLMGTVLIAFFRFNMDEMPFMSKEEHEGTRLAERTLTENAQDNAENWHFRMRTNGMVENNSRVLRRNLRRSLRYVRYNPIETVSNFMANFARSLSEIEE